MWHEIIVERDRRSTSRRRRPSSPSLPRAGASGSSAWTRARASRRPRAPRPARPPTASRPTTSPTRPETPSRSCSSSRRGRTRSTHSILRLRYNGGPAVAAPDNDVAFNWQLANDGSLRSVSQLMHVGKGAGQIARPGRVEGSQGHDRADDDQSDRQGRAPRALPRPIGDERRRAPARDRAEHGRHRPRHARRPLQLRDRGERGRPGHRLRPPRATTRTTFRSSGAERPGWSRSPPRRTRSPRR